MSSMFLEIEVGKAYLTRTGQTVVITERLNYPGCPFAGSNGAEYTTDGRFWFNSANGDSDEDLVEEVATSAGTNSPPLLDEAARQFAHELVFNGKMKEEAVKIARYIMENSVASN